MNHYLVTIGLEIHTTVKTNAKTFSKGANRSNVEPNCAVTYLDLGLPGTLPLLNLVVFKKAIQLGHDLNMEINYQNIMFDRKNYFYYDLPKGYQITQYYQPICTNGYITLKNGKKIGIKQIQIEEDTAKQIRLDNQELNLDFNRSGSPLLEIVSEPNFNNATEVLEYLQILKRTLVFLEISDAKIELGNLRVDLNISLRKNENDPFGNKVEIKNIGSFAAVEAAINYEIKRQSELLNNNQVVDQETRRWDETSLQTQFMRKKDDAVGYFFMPEPNLPIFSFTQNDVANFIENSPVSWKKIENALIDANLSEREIDNVLDHYEIYLMLQKVNALLNDYKESYKWVAMEILGFLTKKNWSYNDLNQTQIDNLINTIKAVKIDAIINGKQAKIVFEKIINENKNLAQIIIEEKMEQITDEKTLSDLCQSILDINAHQLNKFLDNELKFEKFIIGQIMAKTQGQANPKVAKVVYDKLAKPLLNLKQ